MKKRFFVLMATLLAVLTVSACVIPVPPGGGGVASTSAQSGNSSQLASAKDEQTGLSYTPTQDGLGYEVCGYDGTEEHVVIPDSYNGVPVVGVYNRAFEKNATITEVTLGQNVAILRDKAFFNCPALVKVNMVPALKVIGPSAFASCAELKDCLLVEGLEEIQMSAFANCSKLAPIVHTSVVDETKQFHVFFIPTTVKLIDYSVWNGIPKTAEKQFVLWYPGGVAQSGTWQGYFHCGARVHPYADLVWLR